MSGHPMDYIASAIGIFFVGFIIISVVSTIIEEKARNKARENEKPTGKQLAEALIEHARYKREREIREKLQLEQERQKQREEAELKREQEEARKEAQINKINHSFDDI